MKFLGVRVRQGPHRRTDGLGEMGQYLGVQDVGLGQPASGLGEVPHLAGIDHHHWQGLGSQSTGHGQFQAASGLQDNYRWRQGPKLRYQMPNPGPIVSHGPDRTRGPDSYIQPVLGHVDACVNGFLCHATSGSRVGPFLQHPGLPAQATVRALPRKVRRPCFQTVCRDQDPVGLPHHHSLQMDISRNNVKIQDPD